MFHDGNRELQAAFGSTDLADKLVERLRHDRFTEDDRDFIESLDCFFLATSSATGAADCSFKGGPPGFVKVMAPDLLVWPDYDGNGMFKSLGNIRTNPQVGLLFIRMGDKPRRVRVNGAAVVHLDDELLGSFEGAQAIIRVTPVDIFPNCPRYIPDPSKGAPSPYTPRSGEPRLEPAWKSNPAWSDVTPPRRA